ncbi:MAG: apolipoprotein N-acyltransferase [Gammaproteobacteria bacterium]
MALGTVLSPLLQTDRWPAMMSSLLAGSFMTLAFAPFDWSLLVYPLMALLFYHWLRAGAFQAFLHVWLFSLGMRLSGICWIFFSLYFHGDSPAILAVAIVVLLSAGLALFPATAAYLATRYCRANDWLRLMLVFPCTWLLAEWTVGITLTGFAWMQPGYTQIDWPLAGYAPLFGNHAVGGLVAVCAGALTAVVQKTLSWQKVLIVVGLIWVVGWALQQINWTEPAGEEIKVALIQGNIPQALKWKRHMHSKTLAIYRDLTLEHTDADLIIWPETAIPDYRHRVPGYIIGMRQAMQQSDTDLLMGLFIKNLDSGRYYNSVLSVNGGEYRKRHLVPLGEYIPLRSLIGFFSRWINIPMSDIDSGPDDQSLLVVAGQPVGVSICFEDIFSRDVRRDLPQATILVNVSNDAWFDGSHEPRQHHAIARMRALESGRYMLRATNTGISSIIGPKGEEVLVAPALERHVLRGNVTPLKGQTPYVFWGDGFALLFALLVPGAICLWPQLQKRASP